ncbi:restriction endonuclease subunit S [Patescibacteria group bacterium]|nr:restriction endonuclease subunit S [Patescibacteria group bacterium]
MQYSIVNYKTVKENSDFRIDSDCFVLLDEFRKKYPKNENEIFLLDENYIKIIDGDRGKNYPNGNDFQKEGYCVFLNTSNVLQNGLELSHCQYITKEKDASLGGGKLQKNDIVFTTRGTIGNVGIYNNFIGEENLRINSGMIIFRLKNILPEYFFVLLVSDYFKKQIKIYSSGSVQSQIPIHAIKQLKIPIFSQTFQNKILEIENQFSYFLDQSKSLYSQAEQLLLSELGLLDWKPKHTLAFVKNFSDTKQTERIDAEYFQPKYEEIIDAVKKYEGGFDELGNLIKIKDKNFTPDEKKQYKYIELSNISANGEISGYLESFGNELPSRARREVVKGDVVVSSIEGSLGSIALITENWTNALCSSGFFVANSDKINSETLLVLLKTKIGQMQLKKGCKGTILTAINKDELSKIVLPKIGSKTQEQIKEKITEMYQTKKLSKSLLEIAKRGVEMAIEKDEPEAEKWINGELDKLEIKF